MVSVPPIITLTVGALIVAWKTPLPPVAEQDLARVIQRAALDFASW